MIDNLLNPPPKLVDRVAQAVKFKLATGPINVPAAVYQDDAFLQSVSRCVISAIAETESPTMQGFEAAAMAIGWRE